LCKGVWLPPHSSIARIGAQLRSSKSAANEADSSVFQVCWEKFNQYFEVEGRYVPVEVDYPVMSVDRIEQYADENTIGELRVRFSM